MAAASSGEIDRNWRGPSHLISGDLLLEEHTCVIITDDVPACFEEWECVSFESSHTFASIGAVVTISL